MFRKLRILPKVKQIVQFLSRSSRLRVASRRAALAPSIARPRSIGGLSRSARGA
jgi:hypothetical protein